MGVKTDPRQRFVQGVGSPPSPTSHHPLSLSEWSGPPWGTGDPLCRVILRSEKYPGAVDHSSRPNAELPGNSHKTKVTNRLLLNNPMCFVGTSPRVCSEPGSAQTDFLSSSLALGCVLPPPPHPKRPAPRELLPLLKKKPMTRSIAGLRAFQGLSDVTRQPAASQGGGGIGLAEAAKPKQRPGRPWLALPQPPLPHRLLMAESRGGGLGAGQRVNLTGSKSTTHRHTGTRHTLCRRSTRSLWAIPASYSSWQRSSHTWKGARGSGIPPSAGYVAPSTLDKERAMGLEGNLLWER